MWDTLGLWLGPLVAVALAAIFTRWVGWFQPASRRRVAIRRIAEALAAKDSHGYDHLYDRYLEHYLGGRHWQEEQDKMFTHDTNGVHDARGPKPRWWQFRRKAR